jgi:predicted DNA-binding protein (UPF0278 family)
MAIHQRIRRKFYNNRRTTEFDAVNDLKVIKLAKETGLQTLITVEEYTHAVLSKQI